MDALKNLATSTVATAPSPATSGTSLVVAAGTGARYPSAPFDVTLYAPGTRPDPTNAEIARCTAVSTDTLTLTRAQYGTTAQSVAFGWYVDNDVTANLLTQISTMTVSGDLSGSLPSPTVAKVNGVTVTGTPATGDVLTATSSTAADWAAPAAGALSYAAGNVGNYTLTTSAATALTTDSLAVGTWLFHVDVAGNLGYSTPSGASYVCALAVGTASATWSPSGRSSDSSSPQINVASTTIQDLTLASSFSTIVTVTVAGTMILQMTGYNLGTAVNYSQIGYVAIKIA